MRSITSLLVAVALLAPTGCESEEPELPDYGICGEAFKDIPVEINRDMDILFVIDTSPSMADEQASLLANFSRFVNVLENVEGGLPSVHIGVISADLGAGSYSVGNCLPGGDDAELQSTPRGDCDGPQDAFISDIANYDGTRTRNYSGDLADAFACIAALGNEGCEFPQPLAAARRALDGSVAANDGFVRENAFLAVFIISDQDDCSASDPALFDPSATALGPLTPFRCFEYGVKCSPDEPRVAGTRSNCQPRADSAYFGSLQEQADALRGLKNDPSMVVVSATIGNPEPVEVSTDADDNPTLAPSCQSPSGSASPGIRLAHYAELFPQRNTLTTICNEDYSDALIIIANLLAKVLGVPCVEGAIDLEPDTAGLQYDCVASDVRFPGTDEQVETLLRKCDTSPPEPGTFPCWELRVDPMYCPDTETQTVLEVYRSAASVPAGTHTILRCSTGCSQP